MKLPFKWTLDVSTLTIPTVYLSFAYTLLFLVIVILFGAYLKWEPLAATELRFILGTAIITLTAGHLNYRMENKDE